MIYLLSKIIAYLLTALGIGFGMGWFVQFSQAKRLREQLNGVIFETKSRIPQLETAITTRDQKIEQLSIKLADNSSDDGVVRTAKTQDDPSKNDANPATVGADRNLESQELTKTYETELAQLRETVAELKTELELANSMADEDLAPSKQQSADTIGADTGPDNFLDEIKDIFDGDEGVGELASSATATSALDTQRNVAEPASHAPDKATNSSAELEELRLEYEELNEVRRKQTEIIDNQTRELEQVKEQQNLQDKSLTVLNQQLELSRLANERIVRELQGYKNATHSDGADNQSANA